MHPQDSRKMSGLRKGLRTWKWHFLLRLWILMLANPQRNVHAYFLGDIKAVLNGCEDHWTLQDEAAFPRLYRMTVCVNVRVVAPGPWIAFTYSSVHGLMPELGLEGDEGALYVWLLRVRHRFPIQLSLQDWHQVCLRRDVVGHALSLEVDGRTVGHRVVIAQAIPSSGSLWLGCGQRDQPEGVAPGQVELYLFRLWADLQQHEPCEDGSVIGWKSDYWGVTSANARQRDDNLPCVHRKPHRRYRRQNPDVNTQTPEPSTELTCQVQQLCSNDSTYFWMPVSVKKEAGFESERDIHVFLSSVFNCEDKGRLAANHQSIFDQFCQGVNSLKVENVSCIIEDNKKKSRCGVVLQLSPTVSACKLRRAGHFAQQQTKGKPIEVTHTGKVERVGWCGDLSSGGFVTCPSLPLKEICHKSNGHSTLTCNIIKPDHAPNNTANQNFCPVHRKPHRRYRRDQSKEEETPSCNCSTFCEDQNHFYAQQLNVTRVNAGNNREFLQNMVIETCGSSPNSQCVTALDVLQNQGLNKTYVNCQKIHSRSYSCMMILEMTKPIINCSVITVIQTLINNTEKVTMEGPLTHTVLCGDPEKSIKTMLTSKLTWFLRGIHPDDVCEKDQPHLKCADNGNLTVLLSGNCPPPPTRARPTIITTAIPSTTTTMTQAKTTIPSTHSTSPPTTTPTTVTTAAVTTITHTSSSTLHPTKVTDTHNTEVTTTAQSEPTLRTTTLSDTTLKTANIQTPATTVMTSETATSSIATQGLADATTSNTLASTINEASEPTSANPTTATTTLRSTSDDTTTSKALPTTSISTPPTTKPDTTVPTANSNTITATTASTAEVSYDTDEPNTVSTSTTSRITTEEATAVSTTVDNTVSTTAVDSTTRNNADTTKGDEMSMTTVAQTTEVSVPGRTTLSSTMLTTTAATTNNNTTIADFTSSKTIDTTIASTTSSTLLSTTMTDSTTTNGTTQTTPNPLTSAVTGSISSTMSSDTVATTIATQMTSTQMPDTSGTSLQSTTTGETTTDATSEPITAETTQVTTTSASHGASTQQQMTINTSEGTSQSESTTNPTTAETTATETTTVTTISGVTASTTSSTTRTTVLPSSVTEHSVTTSSNATTVGTPITSKIQNNTAVTSDVTRITSTAVSEMHNTTTTGPKMTTTAATTPFTPKSNVTMLDTTTMVTTATTATTTAFTLTTEQATVTIETDTSTSMASLKTTTSSKDTTLNSINTSTIAQDTTIKVSDKKPETTTSNAVESTTASTQASKTTSNIAAYLTTSSTTNVTSVESTHSSTTTITPTSIQTTDSTIKTSVHATAEVTGPGSVLSSQSPTPTVTPVSTATITSTTYNRTTITAEASRTTLQTTTTWDTSKSAQTTRSQQDLVEEASNLLSQTEDVSRLNSSQVSKLVGQLESLLDGPTVSRALGKMAINIISNLMEGDARALSASANRMVRLVDELGLKLEVSGANEVLSATSLVLAVQTVDWSEFPTTTIIVFSTDDIQINGRRPESSGATLGSMVLPSSLPEGLSPEEQHQVSTVQFTYYTKNTLFQDPTLDNEVLVSPVLSCSVANLSITNLRENIQFTIRNVKPMKTNHSVTCVFWDFKENGGVGGWNNSGCHVVDFTPENTTCSCSHLTSFAVLLNFSREGMLDQKQAQVLTFITYIGCGVSAVFLSITILTYLSFEKLLRDIPAKILVQLCISLLGLNLVFLLDSWLALHKVEGLCISTAFFLHYFLLTSFTWAGLEALHMYLSIVRVFTPYLSKYMMKFTIMGWGIPLIVPVIIIAVDKDNYGLVSYGKYSDGTTDDFCWLRDDIAFYVGVVAYFLLMFILCLIIFIVVLVQLARIKRKNPQNQCPNRGLLTDLRSISGLIILLGLTWGFALFAWGPLYLPFIYLFCIFNSLQGFFIFVFHCAVKENVQRQWRTYLCCGRLRLPENSEWSRTATHNNKNTSFTIMSSSAAHLASSSSSVVSETNSSGSAYVDSGISDGSTSDVVLNEIHRRNMTRHL